MRAGEGGASRGPEAARRKGAPRLPDPSVSLRGKPRSLCREGGGRAEQEPEEGPACRAAAQLLRWSGGDVVVVCVQNRAGARDGGSHPPAAAPLLGSARVAGVPSQLHQSPSAAAAEHASQGTGPRAVGCGCAAHFLAGDSARRPDHAAL